MKKFTLDTIKRWKDAPRFAFTAPRKALPFPGKSPTRIYLETGGCFRYFGKPDPVKIAQFLQAYTREGHVLSIEFDRGGPIVIFRHGRDYGTNALFESYHPNSRAHALMSWF